MFRVHIPEQELFNEETNEFFQIKACTLQLEHSLVSLSKWESKWKKPFITGKNKTREETVDYIRCMTITQNVDAKVYECITNKQISDICDYIEDSMTAATVNDYKRGGGREFITAEIIYYWMIALGIPFECQKWHLNRLLMLIRVCNIKQDAGNKMSNNDILKQNEALNAARRKIHHSKG